MKTWHASRLKNSRMHNTTDNPNTTTRLNRGSYAMPTVLLAILATIARLLLASLTHRVTGMEHITHDTHDTHDAWENASPTASTVATVRLNVELDTPAVELDLWGWPESASLPYNPFVGPMAGVPADWQQAFSEAETLALTGVTFELDGADWDN